MGSQRVRSAHARVLSLVVVTVLACVTIGLIVTLVPFPERESQSPAVGVERLVEQFVRELPGRASQAYDAPSVDDRKRFGAAVRLLASGRKDAAARLVGGLDYRLESLAGDASGRSLLVLHETRTADGDWPHGWGLFIFDLHTESRVIVEVPHPLYDVNTPQVGVALFEAAHARALFVAGTHRYANADGTSDVAHSRGSVFDAANRALVVADSVVVQPHGFDESDHPDDGDLVLSSGMSPPSDELQNVATALTIAGFAVCTYGEDYACHDLGGTTNLQGREVRQAGGQFLQVEIARAIRGDPVARLRVAVVIARSLRE